MTQSPFNFRSSPFDLGHIPYVQLNSLTASPMSAIETKRILQRLIRFAEQMNERLEKVEARVADNRGTAAETHDTVRSDTEATLPGLGSKRSGGKATG
jgi:hypothetical protein